MKRKNNFIIRFTKRVNDRLKKINLKNTIDYWINEMNHKYHFSINVFLIFILILASIRCDSLVPAEFKAKTYRPEELDVMACNWLSIDLIDSLGYSNYYAIRARTLQSFVDSATRANNTDNQIIHSRFDVLVDSLSPSALVKDSLMVVRVDTTQNTAYALLRDTVGQPKDIYIYVSLQYSSRNVLNKDYVSVKLVSRDTTLAVYSDQLSLETIAACSQSINVVGVGTQIVPTIRARYRIHLEDGVYIVRFVMSNAGAVQGFKLLIF